MPKRLINSRKIVQPVKNWQNSLDALLIRGPTPLLSQMAASVGRIPVVLLIVGDNRLGIDAMSQPLWRKELIRLLWNWNHYQQNKVMKRSLTFVNSHQLYEFISERNK